MITAVGYVRVSTEDQGERWSLDGQEQEIHHFAARNGYEITQVYRDEMSGSKENRPGLDQLLYDAHNHQFEAIIVVSSSRWFRNVVLARSYKHLLRNKLGIDIIFVDQPHIDPSDPASFIAEAVGEVFDEYYLRQLSFWTRLGKKTRAERGLWNGTLSFGYTTNESGIPIPHPKNAAGVRLAFEKYATGNYSDRQIADLLNREGYHTTGNWGERPFTKDTINRLLKNQFYLGFTKYKQELFPGQHEAIISQELFDKCQEVRRKRSNRPRSMGTTKQIYIFSGLARCHECKLTLRCVTTQSVSHWRYYRHTAAERGYTCSVPGKFARADSIESQWAEIISKIQLPADWQEQIEALVTDQGERDKIGRERDWLEEKLKRIARLYQDMMIDESEYKSQRDQLQRQLNMLVVPENRELKEAGTYLQNIALLWDAASLEEQQSITQVMLNAIYVDVMETRILAIEPNPLFAFLLTEVCDGVGVKVITT